MGSEETSISNRYRLIGYQPKEEKTSKYTTYVEDVSVEAVFDKLGGINGVRQFLNGNVEITVITHTIDIGASLQLPFDGAEVFKHDGTGIVEIELRSDDNLYVDGKKVKLFLSEMQKGNKEIVGHELCQEFENGEQVLLNNNVLDLHPRSPRVVS